MKKSDGYFSGLSDSFRTIYAALKTTLPYMLGWSEQFKEGTEEYPDRVSARMPEDLPVRYRGFLENKIEECSGCGYCLEACPVDCIEIKSEPGPSMSSVWVAVFDIDHSKCMFCGLCVEVCPTGSLKHTREYEGATFRLIELVHSYGRGWATNEMKAKWAEEQKVQEEKADELAKLEENPFAAALKQRNQERRDG